MARGAYYNDNDATICEWLRGLIRRGYIADGEVDCRSILEVRPEDIRDFVQVHLFAGIGGWSHALRLAGWEDTRPIWTISCPCQPLSGAGLRRGHADERHLWPAVYNLLDQCRPPGAIGEQVASADGREWLAGIRFDMENLGYAVGAADLCSPCVGAPNIRQRLYWVADAKNGDGRSGERGSQAGIGQAGIGWRGPASSGDDGRLVDAEGLGKQDWAGSNQHEDGQYHCRSTAILCSDGKWRRVPADDQGQPEPSLFPLAPVLRGQVAVRVPGSKTESGEDETHYYNRRIALSGAGNAINARLAAKFIQAVMGVLDVTD